MGGKASNEKGINMQRREMGLVRRETMFSYSLKKVILLLVGSRQECPMSKDDRTGKSHLFPITGAGLGLHVP